MKPKTQKLFNRVYNRVTSPQFDKDKFFKINNLEETSDKYKRYTMIKIKGYCTTIHKCREAMRKNDLQNYVNKYRGRLFYVLKDLNRFKF